MDPNPPAIPAPVSAPPRFDSRAAANATYHRIMTGAAELQKLLNFHVVQSAMKSDPAGRAQSLDAAIRYAERMVIEFRRARDVLAAAAPSVSLPPPPAPTAGLLGHGMPSPIKPRRM